MRLYDCKVRLGGNLANEVLKQRITAAEIMVLKQIHGPDSVINVTPVGQDKRGHSAERARLTKIYVGDEEADGNLGGHAKKRARILTDLFGPSHVPLPNELPVPEGFTDPEDAPAPKRRVLKSAPAEDIAAEAIG